MQSSPSMTTTDEKCPENNQTEHVYAGETLSTPRQILLVGTICMANFTNIVGLCQALVLKQQIGSSFNMHNPGELSWLLSGYSLTVGTFILIAGRLGDYFGYKRMYLIGMGWFALWYMISGIAVYSNHVLFIFCRVLSGIGPAISLPNGLAILGNFYAPGPKKNIAFALFGAFAPNGAVVGMVLGSVIALAWWPWAYWGGAIAFSALALFSAFIIPPQEVDSDIKHQTLPDKIAHLDLLGSLTGVAALVLVNFAWNQAAVVGWKEPYVYVCLILGVLVGVLFLWVELHFASDPILPLAALNSDVAFVLGCTACGWACFGVWLYYVTTFVMEINGASPLLAAAWHSPCTIMGFVAAIGAGILLGRMSPAWVMMIGLLAFTVASILIATMPAHQIYWGNYFFGEIIMCLGIDSSFAAATIVISNAVPPKYQGIGASLITTVVNYSSSLALGIAGTIEREVTHGGQTYNDKLKGYRGAFYFHLGLAALGLVLSIVFLLKGYVFDRKRSREESLHSVAE